MREEWTQGEPLKGVLSGANGTRIEDGKTRSPDRLFHSRSSVQIQKKLAFEPVLDSEEAAALLKIHPKTLQKLARRGKIPGFRIGKFWGFRASALNRWLESTMAS
jgi:excisionase family DNA binding protein